MYAWATTTSIENRRGRARAVDESERCRIDNYWEDVDRVERWLLYTVGGSDKLDVGRARVIGIAEAALELGALVEGD